MKPLPLLSFVFFTLSTLNDTTHSLQMHPGSPGPETQGGREEEEEEEDARTRGKNHTPQLFPDANRLLNKD